MRDAVEALRGELLAEYDSFTSLRKQYDKSRPAVDARINALTNQREKLEQEIERILMEKIGNR